ncbi:MAG: hypothetical protein R2873_30440 [Caldilineaceae bacterium]
MGVLVGCGVAVGSGVSVGTVVAVGSGVAVAVNGGMAAGVDMGRSTLAGDGTAQAASTPTIRHRLHSLAKDAIEEKGMIMASSYVAYVKVR